MIIKGIKLYKLFLPTYIGTIYDALFRISLYLIQLDIRKNGRFFFANFNCSAWPRLKLNTKMGLNHPPHYTKPNHQEILDLF